MAAPQFEGGKIKNLEHLKNLLMHDEKHVRMIKQHKNVHLDTELTPLNYSYRGLSMSQRLERITDVLAKCKNYDSNQTGENRNDLVILHSVILYPPDEVSNDRKKSEEWFNQVGIPVMVEIFGEDRILDVDIHFDEIHEFIDPDTHKKKISKIHAHALIMPFEEREAEKYVKDQNGIIIKDPVFDEDGEPVWQVVKKTGKIRLDKKGNPIQKTKRRKAKDGTKEIVLNARKVTGTANIIMLNNELEQRTKELFGFSYHSGKGKATYINEKGEEVKDKRTVEQLKIASTEAADDLIAEQEEKKKALESEIADQEEEIKYNSGQIADQEDELRKLKDQIREQEEVIHSKEDKIAEQKESIISLRREKDEVAGLLASMLDSAEAQKKDYEAVIRSRGFESFLASLCLDGDLSKGPKDGNKKVYAGIMRALNDAKLEDPMLARLAQRAKSVGKSGRSFGKEQREGKTLQGMSI